jgi:hypothetical protein
MTVIRPVPAQALQMIRSPRSRTRPVPQHRSQVCWTAGAGRSLCMENRLPKTIRLFLVLRTFESKRDIIDGALRPRQEIA